MISILPGNLGVNAAAGGVFSAYDPARVPTGLFAPIFSNNNRTIATNAAGSGYALGAQGTLSHSTGKWYFEVTMTQLGALAAQMQTNDSAGFVRTPQWYNVGGIAPIGSDSGAATGVGVGPNGGSPNRWQLWVGSFVYGTFNAPAPAAANGQVLGFAIDMAGMQMWFRLQAYWLNASLGNPVTTFPSSPDTNGQFPNNVQVLVASTLGGPSAAPFPSCTLNTGNTAFANAPPPGFLAWG